MPTPALFDFDASELGAYYSDRVDALLTERPAEYVGHLTLARQLTEWARRVESQQEMATDGYQPDQWREALLTVVAHLRQGDFLHGGPMHQLIHSDETGSGTR